MDQLNRKGFNLEQQRQLKEGILLKTTYKSLANDVALLPLKLQGYLACGPYFFSTEKSIMIYECFCFQKIHSISTCVSFSVFNTKFIFFSCIRAHAWRLLKLPDRLLTYIHCTCILHSEAAGGPSS